MQIERQINKKIGNLNKREQDNFIIKILYKIPNNQTPLMQYVIDNNWKWVECNLVIKRLPQKQYHEGLYQSLEAEVQLASDEADVRNFESEIIMEKPFEFQQGKGFIWHKSWYIPEIVLKLSPKLNKVLKQENHIKKIFCEMLSGYPFKKDQHFYLQQVRLEGDNVKQFNKKGQVTFSNLKFSQTSFNKNKNKFSIILVIYTSFKENERSIIKSFISSPIHVDSRKQARKKISANTFIQDEISLNKFLTKLQGSQKLVNQNYSYQQLLTIYGFVKYYTAANIRFKIKHPYYIGYHFQDVFDVYYNSEQASDPVDVLDIIYQNQKKQSQKAKSKPKEKKDIFHDNKQILKKSSPKILMFLIKNAPKQCFLIKDQIPYSQEKIQLPSQNILSFKQSEQKFPQKESNHQKIIEKPFQLQRQKKPNLQNGSQNKVQNGQDTVKNCLVHIIQTSGNKAYQTLSKEDISQKEQKQFEEVENNQNQQMVKQQQISQQQQPIEFPQKIVGIQEKTQCKKQQKKSQFFKQEQAIKKIYSIFESWKFNFIYLKKSDGGLTVVNKKWVYIPPQGLLQSFKTYTNKKTLMSRENIRISNDDGGTAQIINGTNVNNYLTYDIHQVIVLQKGKKSSIVKIQENPNKQ